MLEYWTSEKPFWVRPIQLPGTAAFAGEVWRGKGCCDGEIECRERLGGMLRYYHRSAA